MPSAEAEATYRIISILGKGSYGTCYKVSKKQTNEVYVMKAVAIHGLSSAERSEAFREAQLLQSVSHDNVVAYIESWDDENYLYVIMEYCRDGDLQQR